MWKDFYKINKRSERETETTPSGSIVENYNFLLELEPEHKVYEGHFPSNPVVPGVCQIRMICDLVSLIKEFPCRLIHSDNVKFMTLLSPKNHLQIYASISVREKGAKEIPVTASLYSGETVFIKFKGVFVKDPAADEKR